MRAWKGPAASSCDATHAAPVPSAGTQPSSHVQACVQPGLRGPDLGDTLVAEGKRSPQHPDPNTWDCQSPQPGGFPARAQRGPRHRPRGPFLAPGRGWQSRALHAHCVPSSRRALLGLPPPHFTRAPVTLARSPQGCHFSLVVSLKTLVPCVGGTQSSPRGTHKGEQAEPCTPSPGVQAEGQGRGCPRGSATGSSHSWPRACRDPGGWAQTGCSYRLPASYSQHQRTLPQAPQGSRVAVA